MSQITKKINLHTAPNTSRNNKTGSWRTKKPVTDYALCIGCSICAKVCPEGCIEMTAPAKATNSSAKVTSSTDISSHANPAKLKPLTDYDFCKGCALCAHECPVKAISMVDDIK